MNQYTLDGVPLRDPQARWFTDRSTGVRIIPARRIPSLTYPGVDGNSFIPRSPYDPGSVFISLNVQGNTYLDLRRHMEFITGLFTQRGKLMELHEHYDDDPNNDRIAWVTLASSVEPKMTSRTSAIMSFVLSIPGTFWRSADIVEGWTPPLLRRPDNNLPSGIFPFELPTLYGGNAPITDLMLKISGGTFGTAMIKDPASGNQINISEKFLTSDDTILIDTANWNAIRYKTSVVGPGNWSMDVKSGVPVNDKVESTRGVGSMFTLEPTLNAEAEFFGYRIEGHVHTINESPPTTGTAFISYRGRKAYL